MKNDLNTLINKQNEVLDNAYCILIVCIIFFLLSILLPITIFTIYFGIISLVTLALSISGFHESYSLIKDIDKLR